MGIETLINDDSGHIKSLNEEISRYQNKLNNDQNEIRKTESLLRELENKKNSSERLIAEYDKRAIELQKMEKEFRQKVAFFTNVALFYGKLSILLQQVEHRIDDVVDIVNELNDSTPTIIDFDSSGEDLISLKQALEKFDRFLGENPKS